MAKTNAKANKEMDEQLEKDAQPVQESTGTTDTAPETQAKPENGEEKLPVQPEQGGSEQTDDKGSAGMDTGTLQEKDEPEGDHVLDPVDQDDFTEEEYLKAKETISQMVSEAVEESGMLDEPVETTEKRNRIAKDVFEKNPQCKTLYFTGDLIPFFIKSDAFRHGAVTLKDDTIVTINRK